ncbi:hypothetical protein [Thiococcus pfennigii]|jgi:hypothetical protein|uniref:hypothetical protein n=1 Tax=Thiococcus pfennigii TaxID=1057 RepID=UPI001907C898|nr:hypothetical protein [Thiococcus pfennigii]MBK1699674.1 hypothetical protein [Thiococcus pfennigii]MBK1733229.1 hypothetical protein [Thiococcus pfennigii]
MLRFSLPSLLKYLVGILLVQGVTVLLVVTAMRSNPTETWWLFVAIGVAVGILVALWFTSLAEGHRRKAESRLKERHYREREAIRTKLEKEKAKAVKTTEREAARARARAASGNMLKTGALVAGGVGVVLMMTQFVTVGLLSLTTAGGLLLGYGVRARQDRWRQDKLVTAGERPINAITLEETKAIAAPAKRARRGERKAAPGQLIEEGARPGEAGDP